jgi:MFS family permease
VALASAGTLPVILDSAVNIAFPAISAAFAAPVGAIQWVVIAYVFTDAALLLPAGWLADRLGHRRVFAAGLAVTGVALALCGAAPAFGWLVGARVLQGVGAALVMGTAPALVTLASPDAVRGRALGSYHLAVGLGAVIGPLAGGGAVAAWGWPAVYWGRVPLAALALVWACSTPGAAGRPEPRGGARTFPPLADPRGFAVANAANLLANTALFFVWLLVPYYLLGRRGLQPGPGGLLFAIGPLATALGAPLGGRAVEWLSPRRLAALALGLEALGLGLTSRLDAAASPAAIALALALAGGGAGLFSVPNMHYVMAALPRGYQGSAGSLVVLMRMGGILTGARLATWIHAGRLAAHREAGRPGEAAEALAFADAFGVAAAIAAAAMCVSLLPPRREAGRARP